MVDAIEGLLGKEFDRKFYATAYPDVAATGVDPLEHYLTVGWREGRDPTARFSTRDYLRDFEDVSRSKVNPFVHYLAQGRAEARAVKASTYRRHKYNIRRLAESGLFDPTYYAKRYSKLGKPEFHVEHFYYTGAAEGRWPNPYFHTDWYLRANPDVGKSGVNPLFHYLIHGDREGRRPGRWFDPAWYRKTYSPDSRWSTALAHYLHEGIKLGLSPMACFDVSYYLGQYQDIQAAGIDPVQHFFVQGYREGRNPSADFDTAFYRERYLANSDANPLLHYIETGRALGYHTRSPELDRQGVAQQVRFFTNASAAYEERDPFITRSRLVQAKALAFYLPQFHAIPENDVWWGKGFTEWRNVARGLPRFEGHYQPRIPGDLGHYDLSNPEVLGRQITLARESGLFGFCFYYYSFNGKRLLEKPIEQFLGDPSLDFPFCLIWANENWTRRWDGFDNEILLSQDYDHLNEEQFLAELHRHFVDPRYIRIDGRPLFLIYRIGLIPEAKDTIARWRGIWFHKFACEPLILMAQGFGQTNPNLYGLDGAVEFPPHKLAEGIPTINDQLEILDARFEGRVHSYDDLIARSRAVTAGDTPLIRTVIPGWDNDARRQGRGTTFHGSTPEKYQQWLVEMIEFARSHPFHGEPLVFINAWNEWAEAAYLEPDVHYGAAYLNATARALTQQQKAVEKLKILLVGHDAHPHGAQLLLLRLAETLTQQFGLEVAVILLGEGPLVGSYRSVTEVHVVDTSDASLAPVIEDLADRGFRLAIANTTVAGAALPILKSRGFVVVSLVHELPRLIQEYHLQREVKAIVQHADKVVFAAAPVAAGFQSLAEDFDAARAVIRPQGHYTRWICDADATRHLREQLGLAKGDKLVINVAYADFRKGFDIFQSVAKLVLAGRNDVHFAWLGNAVDAITRWLLSDLEGTDWGARFHMLDRADNPAPLYEIADLFFLSSREDPFPTVLLDALRAGLPVVALKECGGFVDIVAEHGRLVDRSDFVAMADAIIDLLDAPEAERKASAKKRRRLIDEQFRFDAYAYELLRLLQPKLAKVSVVVPNYNYARYLRQRLDTIYAQTHPIFEVLVLDDHSADDSLDVLSKYASQTSLQLQVIQNKKNSGSVYKQWQKGAELARGDYVWIAEADDLAAPSFLSEAVGLMEAHGASFVFCDSIQIDEGNKTLASNYQYYFDTVMPGAFSETFVVSGEEFVRRFLSIKNLVLNVSAVLWRRDALMKALAGVRGNGQQLRLAADWKMYVIAALECGPVGFIANSLNTHRRHTTSVTRAYDVEQHLAEVAAVQDFVADKLGTDVVTSGEVASYRAELAAQFGLVRANSSAN